MFKKKVPERNPSSQSKRVDEVTEVGVIEIKEDYCCKLVDSMPDRIHAGIALIGGHTTY